MLAFAAILATLDDPFYDRPEHLVKYETPQQRRSYTAWASKLRADLLEDYDQVVPLTLPQRPSGAAPEPGGFSRNPQNRPVCTAYKTTQTACCDC